jgi:hypothetical protein
VNVQWTVGGVLIALALITIIIWLGRDRKMMKVRVGFFLERERFGDEVDPSARTEILWPGQRPSDAAPTIPGKED